MCIIIDTNTFRSVFDKSCKEHDDFYPVYDWILNKKGKIVYGGTKYKSELRLAYRFLRVFGQFSRMRKVVVLDDKPIDAYQEILEGLENHRDFDDPHLVAISYISKCRLICTNEKRALPFLARKDFYPNNSPRPKIYSKKTNANLLCDKYFAEVCEPCVRLNKLNAKQLDKETNKLVRS